MKHDWMELSHCFTSWYALPLDLTLTMLHRNSALLFSWAVKLATVSAWSWKNSNSFGVTVLELTTPMAWTQRCGKFLKKTMTRPKFFTLYSVNILRSSNMMIFLWKVLFFRLLVNSSRKLSIDKKNSKLNLWYISLRVWVSAYESGRIFLKIKINYKNVSFLFNVSFDFPGKEIACLYGARLALTILKLTRIYKNTFISWKPTIDREFVETSVIKKVLYFIVFICIRHFLKKKTFRIAN